jgi:hypothetical protein
MRLGDCTEEFHIADALIEGGAAGKGVCFTEASNLFEECAGLVAEGAVLAEAHLGWGWLGPRMTWR